MTETPEVELPDTPDETLPSDDELVEEAEEQTPAEAAEQDGSAEVAKKLKQATQGYHTRIFNILGAEMEQKICPTCDGFGFADEQQVATSAAGLPDDFVHPENYVTCDRCNGYGEILSGSKNPAHAVVTCTHCSGLGYRIEQAQIPQAAVSYLPPPVEAQTLNGVYVPGRGFIPYGETEPIPGSA